MKILVEMISYLTADKSRKSGRCQFLLDNNFQQVAFLSAIPI